MVQLATAASGWAATSGSIRVGGRVLQRASIFLSQVSLSISSFTSSSALSPLGRRILGAGQTIWLTNLGIRGNGGKYTVSLVSENAAENGRPSLLDPDTGASVPYELTYGGASVKFNGGEARLGGTLGGRELAAAPQPLAIDVPSGTDIGQGHFQEQIVVVIKAR